MNNDCSQTQSMICKKKQEFRKKRRTQYLQEFMKKARIEFMQSIEQSQYKQLRNLIDELFQQDLNQEDKQKENLQRKKRKVLNLIDFANKGHTAAILAISQLLLSKIITVESIEDYFFQQNQRKGQTIRKEIMQIIIFPTKDNDGWLALVRVLINLGYCTQQMVSYCINAIVRSKSMNGLDLSFEVLYILVIEKKLVSIEEIYKLSIKSTPSQNNQRPLRTQELIYALMKHSLDSVSVKQCSNIRYNSTKLLMKSFQTQSVLSDLILKLIPLDRVAIYIKEKFEIATFYDKKKALKMLSYLLICLSNYNHYEPQYIISVISAPIMPILNYIKKLSYEIDVKNSLNERKLFQQNGNNSQNMDENFEFLQQGIFMIQILIDDYLFCSQSFDLILSSLEAFILDQILIYLHSAYYQQIKSNLIQLEEFSQSQNEGLTEQDMLKCLLVQKITKLTKKIISNLINLSQEIRTGALTTSQINIQKFVLLRNLIISRFRKTQLQKRVEKQLYSSGIDLRFI